LKDGKSPIQVCVACNLERIYYFVGKSAFPSEWDDVRQCVKGRSDEVVVLNDYLVCLRNRIYEKEVELMELGYTITPQLLKDAVCDRVEALKEKTLLEVLTEHNDEVRPLVKTIQPATFYCFEYTERLVRAFIRSAYKRDDLFLRELNIVFMQKFHHKLLETMAQNTCAKHLKFLKKILNMSVARGYTGINPFNAYRVEREPVEIDFLDEIELRKIINFETPLKKYEYARDTFLFGCFTGLAYIDIKTLEPEHFVKDEEGRIWIKKKRIKTGILSRIPLLPMAKMILDKYKVVSQYECFKGEKRLLPIQDASDVNVYLKDIAILCKIDKRITFHTSRHTFASTVTLSNNISLDVVSKMMGHTNTRMTSHYAKLVDKCIAEQMDKISDIFSAN